MAHALRLLLALPCASDPAAAPPDAALNDASDLHGE
jgi:hypothetical protein